MDSVFPLNLHTLIWGIIILLAIFWFIGLIRRGTTRFIHILLVVAILLVLYNFFLR